MRGVDNMKIVGTIVNKNMVLTGLLIKAKPEDFGFSGSQYLMKPFKLDEVKQFINKGKIKDFVVDNKGDIVGKNNKKLADLPMFDSRGNPVNKQFEIRSIVEDEERMVGAVVFIPAIGEEKKLKIDDLSKIYNYCDATNFVLKNRDNNYYITGRGETKKEDIPIIKSSKNTIDFIITKDNRELVGYNPKEFMQCLDIPSIFHKNGRNYKVVGIAESAFFDVNNLRDVFLPETIVEIGENAFGCCNSLKDFCFPENVKNITASIVFGESLQNVYVENENPYYCDVDGIVFTKDMKKLVYYPLGREGESYKIPKGVQEIGLQAFEGCDYLFNLAIPNGVIKIDKWAFLNCKNLSSVVIPKSIKFIGLEAFLQCSSLNVIYYRGSEEEWDKIEKDGNDWSNLNIVYNYKSKK